jgi:hypothetical protein
MPFALFTNDAQISKAYPTEADVWKIAQNSGLVVDVATDEDRPGPRRVLDNEYEIKSCPAAPGEDPAQNKADADRESRTEVQFNS